MNRAQLEHVIRAAATIAGDTEIVVIGSQAILGRYPQAPAELVVSADGAGRRDRARRYNSHAKHGGRARPFALCSLDAESGLVQSA